MGCTDGREIIYHIDFGLWMELIESGAYALISNLLCFHLLLKQVQCVKMSVDEC